MTNNTKTELAKQQLVDAKIEEIKARVTELQKRLGVQLQVTIYQGSLNESDDMRQAAPACRMSMISPSRGSYDTEYFAVRVVAEGLGEIPYALMAKEIYLEGESGQGGD
jgi:hypothetical protein